MMFSISNEKTIIFFILGFMYFAVGFSIGQTMVKYNYY